MDPAAALLPQVDAAAHALGVMRQLLETHDQRFGAHARRVSELEQENQQSWLPVPRMSDRSRLTSPCRPLPAPPNRRPWPEAMK